jgi:hypothetical protein
MIANLLQLIISVRSCHCDYSLQGGVRAHAYTYIHTKSEIRAFSGSSKQMFSNEQPCIHQEFRV